ncbi:aspartyl-phosphate phosphatase Spo0E family protein [Halobacillus yeomjeoni]|uniref:Spo0E family sporulation regulatory protein-aspartic acid phosphatase n=1 Tax=Halobacillus yeomjeoni TaxID=311194 RepID=UPI001CD72170|nr:aspartyl-phosphate phosphatase Spo0E family protein [Halobacillus yeomjeoni]MCA0983373.1 aspartyl-phosphate phosphatase Spo0E family protein [Halobacillus yeomjeoni]
MDERELEAQIDQMRQTMQKLYLEDPHNPQVLEVSQSLDDLLNELTRRSITNKKK